MYQYGSVRAQQNNIEKGKLRVSVREEDGQPIENAQVQISYTGEPDSVIEEIRMDSSGFTSELELAAPPLEYSMSPVEEQPYAEYTVKIQEAEIKPVNNNQAKNYYVRYKDYIKNVASSEIYAIWPDDSIRANVLAIMSFTLNRVYTETTTNPGLQKRYS